MSVVQAVQWLVIGAELWPALAVLYLFIVSVAAIQSTRWRNQDRSGSAGGATGCATFAILVPAHNEELLLGTLLDNLRRLDYPEDRYMVCVVADNCTDSTAAVARATGWVRVYERLDPSRRGKGYALNWLLKRLESDRLRFDAYVVLDADAVVVPGFLRSMNRELSRGAKALQACNTVLNVSDSPGTALRWIALTLINHVRPLGRNALGASSTLTGTGMCLSREVLERFPWEAYSLGEDYQYYLTLIEHGVSVRYVADAVVRSEMPRTFAHMRTQDIRWEVTSHGQSSRQIARRLLMAGIRRRDLACIEAVVELLTPPLSLLVCWSLLALVVSLAVWSLPGVLVGAALIGGIAFYLGTAVYIVRPSRAVCKALLYAPAFMIWKVWVTAVVIRRKNRTREWIRTKRNAPLQ